MAAAVKMFPIDIKTMLLKRENALLSRDFRQLRHAPSSSLPHNVTLSAPLPVYDRRKSLWDGVGAGSGVNSTDNCTAAIAPRQWRHPDNFGQNRAVPQNNASATVSATATTDGKFVARDATMAFVHCATQLCPPSTGKNQWALSRASWHGIPPLKKCASATPLRQTAPQKVGIKRHATTRIVSQPMVFVMLLTQHLGLGTQDFACTFNERNAGVQSSGQAAAARPESRG